jgi:prepilin-type N-terminal cleavage/methylation domain-containing protein
MIAAGQNTGSDPVQDDAGRDGAASRAGFTLLELLVVIAILGLLVVAFTPALSSALGQGDVTETEARQLELSTMIDAYQRYYGEYPTDDFSILVKDKQAGWQFGADNGKNTGIESLVLHLSFESKAGRLDQRLDWLANTDSDKAPVEIPLLGSRERYEVVDSWGTPMAYFSGSCGSGYQGRQRILGAAIEGADALELDAQAWKNPSTGQYLNPRRYQLISAGPDLAFNTDDDIVFPKVPRD